MTVAVRQISASDGDAWDAFVRSHAEGTFCHLAGWKRVVEEGAEQECPYLIAEDAGNIVGILPLTYRKSLLFGDALISSMFAVYGGVLALNEDITLALEEYAWQLAKSNQLKGITYKCMTATHSGEGGWHVEKDSAATFHKTLKSSPEEILLDIPRKQRAVVRKSFKNNLTCEWGRNVEEFYPLYAESVRNLGTPVFPKKLFTAFLAVFKDDVDIQIIRTPEGQAVASLMSFYYKDTVLPYYAGGTLEARTYGAHDYMYYQLMVRAAEKGKTVFDFGRSKIGTGPYKFKCNWGFEPTPLEYQHRLREGAAPPNLNPGNRKFELMVAVWKKLPLPVANILGPLLARHLG